jgi:hypothetical protein
VCDYCRARGLPAELEARLLRYFRFQARANPAPSSLTLNRSDSRTMLGAHAHGQNHAHAQ